MTRDATNFDAKAGSWDADAGRVRQAADVAAAIIRDVAPTKEMDALDFGCGSGLVTLNIQPLVRQITGVDSSRGMLEVLRSKVVSRGMTNVSTLLADVERGESMDGMYHLIVSSMAVHHVTDVPALITRLAGMLHAGGKLAIADLDTEDGSFHDDNTGVRHFGFPRETLKRIFEGAGLRDVHDTTAATVEKQREGQGTRQYTVFLITGTKDSGGSQR